VVNVHGRAIPFIGRHVVDGTGGKPLSPRVNARVVRAIGRSDCRPIVAELIRWHKFNAHVLCDGCDRDRSGLGTL